MPLRYERAALVQVGEMVYSPRLSEYSMMVAPKGREGTYVAAARGGLPGLCLRALRFQITRRVV